MIGKLGRAIEHHRKRHRPTGFGFAVSDRLAYLDSRAWNQVAADGSFFMSRAYLEALERNAPENVACRFAIGFRGEKPVLLLAAQVVRLEGRRLSTSPLLQGLEERAVVCGNLLTWGRHGVAFAAGEKPEELWPAVAEALYRIRRAERLSGQADFTLIKDLREGAGPGGDSEGVDALAPFRYRPLETEPDMVLELSPAWKSYDSYLASLQSKPRSSIRKVHKDCEARGITIERREDLGPVAEELYGLYLQTHEGAKVRLVTPAPGYLAAVAQAAGKHFRCAVLRQGGKAVAFATVIRDGDTAVGYHVGYDRAANEAAPLYHRALHAIIEDAIELRCRRLSFGRTALEAKANLGARPEPLRIWLRHRQPALNALVQGFLRALPHDEAPDRNPFKTGEAEPKAPGKPSGKDPK